MILIRDFPLQNSSYPLIYDQFNGYPGSYLPHFAVFPPTSNGGFDGNANQSPSRGINRGNGATQGPTASNAAGGNDPANTPIEVSILFKK